MKVIINKQEGYSPYVYIKADEQAMSIETLDEWIRFLQIAKVWLKREQKKALAK